MIFPVADTEVTHEELEVVRHVARCVQCYGAVLEPDGSLLVGHALNLRVGREVLLSMDARRMVTVLGCRVELCQKAVEVLAEHGKEPREGVHHFSVKDNSPGGVGGGVMTERVQLDKMNYETHRKANMEWVP